MTSTTSQLLANDGLGLLVRRWACNAPHARILIVHGVGEHSGRYEHVGEFLVGEGFDVTAFDLRGHGASGGDRIDIESFDEYLDDLELVLGETQDDLPTIIYGHSMGGLISASYGMSSRNQPDLYVLSAPAMSADVPAALRIGAKVLSRVRPSLRMPNSIKGEQLSKDPEVGVKYFADPLVETKATARLGAIAFKQMEAVSGEYERLARPALVIHGADDSLVPPHASAPLAAVDGVDRKVFAGLRHEVHNEPEYEEVLGYVVSWVDAKLA